MRLGARALATLGATAEEIVEVEALVRKRDEQRFEVELVGGQLAGRAFFGPKVHSAKDEAATPGAEQGTAAQGEPADRRS